MNPEIKYRVVEDVTHWMTHAQSPVDFSSDKFSVKAGELACGSKVSKKHLKPSAYETFSCCACLNALAPFRKRRVK